MSDDEWPDYDGEGEEDALPPQQGDDQSEADLREELQRRLPTQPYLQSYIGEALRWIDEEESTEVMLVATDLLESNLNGRWPDIMADLRDALREDEGEDLLYALLRLTKELKNA